MSIDDGSHTAADSGQPVEIVLVEDNPGDAILVQEALRSAKVTNHLHLLTDGESAIRYLKQLGSGDDRPSLILLDLNLPKKSGLEVLSEIKGDDRLKSIPTVIMTSSKAEEDIARAYKLQANSYIVKPIDFAQLTGIIQAIEHFWLHVVALPPSTELVGNDTPEKA